MRNSFALLALCLLAVLAPAVAAQEDAMSEEPMFISVTFVEMKAGMEAAFMAAAADHRDWHAETGDTHYYAASEAITGPRSGQIVFSAGPMTAERLNDYDAFRDEDLGDLAARGGMNYVEDFETVVMNTMPGLGNPPPPGYEAELVHVWEFRVDLSKMQQFNEGIQRMSDLQEEVGDQDGYAAWASMVSGGEFGTYWLVQWTDGWSADDPERQERVVEAAGGQEAYLELIQQLTDAAWAVRTASYRPLPHLTYMPMN